MRSDESTNITCPASTRSPSSTRRSITMPGWGVVSFSTPAAGTVMPATRVRFVY